MLFRRVQNPGELVAASTASDVGKITLISLKHGSMSSRKSFSLPHKARINLPTRTLHRGSRRTALIEPNERLHIVATPFTSRFVSLKQLRHCRGGVAA